MVVFPLVKERAINLILQSLSESFNQFILNFNMNDMEKKSAIVARHVENC